MNILYLDCQMGASGDMLVAALLELVPAADAALAQLNAMGLSGVLMETERSVKCGVTGTRFKVTVRGVEEGRLRGHMHGHVPSHSHSHRSMHDIEHLIKDQLSLPERVKKDVLEVYGLIAEAESKVHGVPVTEIHFHEVGTMDAIADIAAVCFLLRKLAPEEVVASPVHVGSGQVKCAHGILPVPAPATVHLLKNIPIYGGKIEGELCTPTGAALLKYFADRFGELPGMKVQRIGYGMGKKDYPAANCIRALLGEREPETDAVVELSCNVDDMTAEAVGFAVERLWEAGARDVYTVPVGMKKNRPGILIRVMCEEALKEKLVPLLFRYTTTIGIRESRMNRYLLDRSIETLHTPFGDVRKKAVTGYGTERFKYEYEDLSQIALERGISLEQARELIGQKEKDPAGPEEAR